MVANSAVRPTSSEDDEAMMTLAFFSSVFFAPLLHRAKDDGDGLLEDEDEEDDPEVERRETICWAWLVALNITDSLSRVCVCVYLRVDRILTRVFAITETRKRHRDQRE